MSETTITVVAGDGETTIEPVTATVTVLGTVPNGPPGVGVPAGGDTDQVLVKASDDDYDTEWADPTGGGGGAPTTADYLVGTANGSLSAEIVVGTSPGGELGGTWVSPTVDAVHSGSSHASVQAAAEATAAAALVAEATLARNADNLTSGTVADARIASTIARDSEVTSAISALSTVYQPLDSDLTAIAALTTTGFGRGLLALADAAALRSSAGLDNDLGTFSLPASTTISAFGATIIDDADATTARLTLGLGTAATQATGAFDAAGAAAAAQAASQPLDSDLTAIAALTTTSFGRAFLALADAAAARTAIGLSAANTPFVPNGSISSTDVQSAIQEVRDEAGSSSVSAVMRSISQTAHGLSVQDVVRFDGTDYVQAQADSASNAEVVGIVSAVADSDHFTIALGGKVSGLSGLTAGTVYFLDPSTAGALTDTDPSTVGQVSKPLLIADSTTSGYFVNFRGEVVGDLPGGGSGGGGWIYGDGSGGDLVLHDGDTWVPGNYHDVTIEAGATVRCDAAAAGWTIYRCTGTFTILGTLDLSGVDAVDRHGATPRLMSDPFWEGSAAFIGYGANGSQTVGATASVGGLIATAEPVPNGGAGGNGSSGSGGPQATIIYPDVLGPLVGHNLTAEFFINSPIGGSGGGGDGTNYGGGGGACGDWATICARHVIHGPDNVYNLQGGNGAPGGDNGSGSTGHGDCGGGGGGGAGYWITISDTVDNQAATIVGGGGSGGVGCGTGTDGGTGEDGFVVHILNATTGSDSGNGTHSVAIVDGELGAGIALVVALEGNLVLATYAIDSTTGPITGYGGGENVSNANVFAPAFDSGTLSLAAFTIVVSNFDASERLVANIASPVPVTTGQSLAPADLGLAITSQAGSDLTFTDGVIGTTAGGAYQTFISAAFIPTSIA